LSAHHDDDDVYNEPHHAIADLEADSGGGRLNEPSEAIELKKTHLKGKLEKLKSEMQKLEAIEKLPKVTTEMALCVLTYNLTRVALFLQAAMLKAPVSRTSLPSISLNASALPVASYFANSFTLALALKAPARLHTIENAASIPGCPPDITIEKVEQAWPTVWKCMREALRVVRQKDCPPGVDLEVGLMAIREFGKMVRESSSRGRRSSRRSGNQGCS
jgi:hypothetical protein